MTLKDVLLQRIAQDGPISVADYMTEALQHPKYGYYTNRDPFGAKGDFTTAPEISQMFGELIGLSLAQAWIDQGAPKAFTLAELGPGRGTLLQDALRATRHVAGFNPDIVLIETSVLLRDIQKRALPTVDPVWIDHLDALPKQPLFIIANEFFDALPIRQFQRAQAGWREIRIGTKAQKLEFGLGQIQRQPVLDHRLADTKDGDIVEFCPTASSMTAQIGRLIANYSGAAIIIDYGDWHSLGDTLQALENHKPVHPLSRPGDIDLTAHVDFECLAMAVAPAKHTKLTPQGVFLERLGITERAHALAEHLSGHALDAHIAAHRRLTHPAEMGNLFKVLGIYPDSASPPPGLDP